MPNAIYGKAKESLFKGEINISSNPLRVLLVDTSQYSVSINVHQFVSDITPAAIKKRSTNLLNLTNILGVIDADNLIIEDHDGSAFNAIILYQYHVNDSSARLIAYIDTADSLPFDGSSSSIPITIVWDNGPNKIISL